MSKQRTLVALDWLMPVLQDIFEEQNRLLKRDDEPMDWTALGQSLHQVSGALTLTNQALLAQLAGSLELASLALARGELTEHLAFKNEQAAKQTLSQAIQLLRYEIQQLQRKQQLHQNWLIDRINFLHETLQIPSPDFSKLVVDPLLEQNLGTEYVSLLEQLPTPDIEREWQDKAVRLQELTKLWRYCTLQLLQQQKNDSKTLDTLTKLANYLATSPLNVSFRQVWHLVALWFSSLALNEKPTPGQYVAFLANLEALMHGDTDEAVMPDFDTGRLAVDVLLHLSQLAQKTENAQNLLATLDLSEGLQHTTVFSQILANLEKTIYQIYQPQLVLPMLNNMKTALANRGWVLYEHQLDVIMNDVQMMLDDENMASSLAWQVERQLQDLYTQILSTVDTLESQIGLHQFAYASDPKQEAVRKTRVHLENVKRSFNNFTKTHSLTELNVNDDLVAMVQVFGLLNLVRPKELTEQLRILLNRLLSKHVAVLSWDVTDAIAEMIARFELFLDYLSHQSVNEELLDKTQSQLNRANLLVKNLIDEPLNATALPSRDKVFGQNTVIYDDEGEKIANADTAFDAENVAAIHDDMIDDDVVFADESSTTEPTTADSAELIESAELTKAREALKPDDFDLADEEIREIFIEEADEVLQAMDANLPIWQADPDDLKTLKEIRRGFHTLKGSGRMVGAYQVGEMAWAVENMLNRVLDGTLSVSEELTNFIAQTRQKIPTLVNDFAQMHAPSIDPAITVLQANNLLAGQPIETGLDIVDHQAKDLNPTSTDQPTEISTDEVENVATVDTIQTEAIVDEVVDEIVDEDAILTEEEENEQASINVFLEEAHELIAKIDTFITMHEQQGKANVTDELVRAFHTLRGGAGIAKLSQVQALSEMLELGLGELLRKEIPLHQEQLQLLKNIKNNLQDYLNGSQTESDIAMLDDIENLEKWREQLFVNVHQSNVLSVSELLNLGIDDLIDADNTLVETFAKDDHEIIANYATVLADQADKLQKATNELSYSVIAETLANAYQMLATYPTFAKDERLQSVLLLLQEQLIGMFDAIAAGLNVFVDQGLIQEIKQLLAEKQHQAQMDAIEYENVDTDIELLQIFLVESQELRVSIQENFNQWQNNLSNTEVVKELRRQYHTLKGGANMVGILSVADLAKQAEKIYDALLTEDLVADPDLVLVMQKVHETTQAQLQYVANQQQSFFAKELVEQLAKIRHGNLSVHDVVLAVPLIVEANQEDVNVAETVEEEQAVGHTADPLYVQEIINNFEQRRLETWQGQEPDEDILGVYLEEAKELIDSSSQNLQEFRSNNNNLGALQALQRELHTIKGGARMVGAEGIANLAHEMESIYEELGSRRKPATRMIGNLLASCHDWLASSLYVLENKYNPQTPNTLIEALQDFSHNPDSLKEIPVVSLAQQIEQIEIYQSSLNREDERNQRDLTVMPAMEGNFEAEQEQVNLNAEMLRISAGLMERMINLSGESAINRARIEMGVSSLTHTIEEMGITVQRLADQLRRMETELEVQILAQIADEYADEAGFDPLEMDQYSSLNQLSKSLSESASDLIDIKATMLDKTRDTENLLLQLSRTQEDLQEGLMNSRTVPFSRITPRLQRIVRQTATELGKSVELRILNDEGEIDRNILERVTSPLEHMLRNAVDHGIEKSQERIEHGKSRTGLITLEVQREGSEIVIHLSDDGKGINVDAVRKKAVEQGLISADDTSLKPLDIMQYIFNAGLSTAKSVSQISGRGVGMDVVQSEVKQLGGVVLVDSEMGKGSRFTMRLPLTVAVSDALVVRAGDKNYAVPLVQIERVLRINTETIYQFHSLEATTLDIDGQDYRLRYLNQILYGSDPLEALAQQPVSVPILIIRTETGQNMALQVDAITGSRIEVVVKPLGPQLSQISGISAATIMGDGSVMLILDLIALMRNASAAVRIERQKTKDLSRKPVVLIIDDSVTVRKVTSRLLERNGYEAQVATDGVDALEKLQELTPDIMLLDIEMPRMDGFEVATQVRHNSRLNNTPIIMITSRTGEKHRERAMSIGVNEYKGKPFQEQDLLDTIARLLNAKTVS
ncbi:CheA signal transduction histidine kinase [Moraxella macacae 0408225]|uniref:Chemotaxis protein CheA n=1 Tax=Moraxella macacae 0408225 TaxID=1230338 RepID=L2F9N0_9GAMM|nr:Hpt domain-containing protein [Moraxella macacae]ELA09747.1 CheA signal transduction histidine kinase [Moraxella macacae 0408225]